MVSASRAEEGLHRLNTALVFLSAADRDAEQSGFFLEGGHLPQNDVILLHRPESAAVEKLFFQRNVRTAISVGQARGVALLALAEANLSIAEYTPLEIKQAVAGYGGADKNQVQQMVRTLLGLDDIPRPDDAADALAVAICHLHSARMNALLKNST